MTERLTMGSNELPSGTVTFLFTDVVGSTRSWASDAEAMSSSLAVHDAILRTSIESRSGYVFTTAGDAFCAAFDRAGDAVAAAVEAQQQLTETDWPGPELEVRMGLHVGDAELRDGDYFGPAVNVAARVAALANGGQILLSAAVVSASGIRDAVDLGTHALRDVETPVPLFQVGHTRFPPLKSSMPTDLTFRFDEFEIDGPARTFRRDRESIHLEPQVFDVLVHLVANADRLVSREELLDEVWGDQFVSLSALTSRIKSARQALGDDGRTQRYIRTEHGHGYQFVGTPTVGRAGHEENGDRAIGSAPAERPARSDGAMLPHASDPLIGRSVELGHVIAALEPGSVVSLVGPGGVGKTRLSIEAARRWSEATGRPVAFIPLDEVRDSSDVRSALATMLGVDAKQASDLTRTCAELLATADGLLVIDNCEHVLEEIADIVDQLRAVAPQLTVLATSREPLRVGAEHVHRLETLAVENGDGSTDGSPAPAVELFVARAHASDAGFELDDQNFAAVERLCKALDGLPLAVELAASRVGTLGLDELAAGLKQKLDVTHAGRRDADHRHHSLRSTIEWSYERLSDDAQRLLSALAHFPAGLQYPDLDALARRLDLDAVTTVVAQLVDTSMVGRRGTIEPRYSMLETVRDYALERSKSFDLGDGLADALVDHALALAEAERAGAQADVFPRARTYRHLRSEIPNIRAAREVLWERRDLERLVTVSSGLTEFTEEACLGELWGWHDELCELADELGPTGRSAALMLGAVSARNRGRLDEAEQLARTVIEADTDDWSVMRSFNVLGMVELFRGDPAGAAAGWRAMDERSGRSLGHVLEAMCEGYLGNVERADALLDEIGDLTDQGVGVRTVTLYYYVAGEVARIAGDASARELLERAVELARENECWFSFGIAQVSLVSTLVADGDVVAAAESYIDVIERWLRSSTWPQLWTTLRNVADLPGDFDDETRLAIVAAAERDTQAPALDEAAAEAQALLMEECRDRLGEERALVVTRTARRVPRAEIAQRAIGALRDVMEHPSID